MTDIEDKMNLLANGRLSEREREELEKSLGQDPALKQELEFMRSLKQGFDEQEIQPPGELGLARLKRDIQREQKQKELEENKRVEPKETENAIWKPLAIAACFVVAVQMAFMLPENDGGSDIVPLSGGGAENITGLTLQLAFKDEARADQIQLVLNEIQGSIVSGPTALGLYTVVVPEGTELDPLISSLQALDIIDEAVATHNGEQ